MLCLFRQSIFCSVREQGQLQREAAALAHFAFQQDLAMM